MLTDHGLAGGDPHRLSQRGGGAATGPAAEARARARAQASRFGFLSQPGERTLAQAAVRFILMNPGVTTVLGGFSDIPQLEEGCAASDLPPLTDEDMARISEAWGA